MAEHPEFGIGDRVRYVDQKTGEPQTARYRVSSLSSEYRGHIQLESFDGAARWHCPAIRLTHADDAVVRLGKLAT